MLVQNFPFSMWFVVKVSAPKNKKTYIYVYIVSLKGTLFLLNYIQTCCPALLMVMIFDENTSCGQTK